MKILFCYCLLLTICFQRFSQRDSFDIARYTAPASWKKQGSGGTAAYTKTEGSNWCQLIIYKNTASKGNIKADLQNEWENIVLAQHSITGRIEKKRTLQQVGIV